MGADSADRFIGLSQGCFLIMRVLIITSTPPYPAQQGGALRVSGIVHGLHQHGHEVTLLCFVEEANPAKYAPLKAITQRIETVPMPARSKTDRLRDLAFSTRPDIAGRLDSLDMRECLRRLIAEQDFDIIQFEGIEMAIYLPFVRELKDQKLTRAALIYDSFNAEAALQRIIAAVEKRDIKRLPMAIYSQIQAGRIGRFERQICQSADAVIAVSTEDATAMGECAAGKPIHILASGIDTSEYATHPQKLDLGEQVLVFTGKMDYRPNVDAMLWFTGEVLPRVQARHPDVKLYIVGQKPHTLLDVLRTKPNIEITGWVPHVQPYLHAASIYVAPLRMGSGTRLKLLEAMASRCAIVATNIAATGLSDRVRAALCLADDAEAQAAAIARLLTNADERDQMGTQLQRLAEQEYDWRALTPALINIYREIGLG